MTNNTQLPAEVEAEIEAYADEITRPLKMDNDYQIGYNNGMEAGAISAGTHFAEKLHTARTLLQKAIDSRSLHNMKDYDLLTEIKTFLDGTK